MSLHSMNFYRKVYYCFEVFFLLEILLRNLDMVVLEESSLVVSFLKKFLADLIMSSVLLKCCLILHILSSKYFAESFGAFLHLLIVCVPLSVISLANFQSLL